jgi:hypothetical protein
MIRSLLIAMALVAVPWIAVACGSDTGGGGGSKSTTNQDGGTGGDDPTTGGW